MKGAITEPCVNTIKVPIKTMVMINGASQYFFLILRKSQMSMISSKNTFILKNFSNVYCFVFCYLSVRNLLL